MESNRDASMGNRKCKMFSNNYLKIDISIDRESFKSFNIKNMNFKFASRLYKINIHAVPICLYNFRVLPST